MAKVARVPKDNVDFKLTTVSGGRTETRTFRLLNLGYCSDHAEAERKANKRGFSLAKTRWQVPFQRKFAKPTRSIDVVFGGSEEEYDSGYYVPGLSKADKAWYPKLMLSGRDFYNDCRWLASRKKSRKS